jgi:hypothetical protein
MFTTQVFGVMDCVTAKKSETAHLIKTAHTIIYTVPELCKPQLISDFSAIKNDGSNIYNLSWSKQDHDLWNVLRYEVRVDTTDILIYDNNITLPVTIDLNSSIVQLGMVGFEVRACASITQADGSTIESCGDWQTTITQCETDCTDQTLNPPILTVPIGNNTTGEYDVSWVGNYSRYVLQERAGLLGNWLTIQDGASLSRHFINQANGSINFYRVKGCFGTVCSPESSEQTVIVRFTPPATTLSASVQTTTDGIYNLSWTASDYATRYELQEKLDAGAWSTIQNNSGLGKSFNKTANHVYSYQVRACNVDECSNYSSTVQVLVDLPITPAAPAMFEVYEDINTQRRFLTWQGNSSNNGLGISSYYIKAYDANSNVVFERQVATDFPQPFVLNSLLPNKYTLSECTINICGDERQDTTFDQGLTRVAESSVIWDTSTTNFSYHFKFKYPQAVFDGGFGKPDWFIITPDFIQPTTNQTEIIVAVGNTNNNNTDLFWHTVEIQQNTFVGTNFTIKACSDALGCGAGTSVVLGTPLTDANLPVPQWTDFNPNTIVIANGTEIDLNWNGAVLNEKIAGTDAFLVDYLEVTERQPVINPSQDFGSAPAQEQVMVYYINRGLNNVFKSQELLSRVNKGQYFFTLKACHRDRLVGDTCSFSSVQISKTLNRSEITVAPSAPMGLNFVNIIEIVDGNVNVLSKTLVWDKAIASKPDYYFVGGEE